MNNDKNQQAQQDNQGPSQMPPEFNEMSEISLEERMRVADQLGVPSKQNVDDTTIDSNLNSALSDDDEANANNEQLTDR